MKVLFFPHSPSLYQLPFFLRGLGRCVDNLLPHWVQKGCLAKKYMPTTNIVQNENQSGPLLGFQRIGLWH